MNTLLWTFSWTVAGSEGRTDEASKFLIADSKKSKLSSFKKLSSITKSGQRV